MDILIPMAARHRASGFHKRGGASFAVLAVALSVFAAFAIPAAAGEAKRVNVLELFTSQGCSSCPPADALLGEYAKRGDVVALSFPVNYWDHLGWRDTLAKDAYNKRQRNYAEARGDREIYTPQLIVNGLAHAVGSQKASIEAALAKTAAQLHAIWVPVSLTCSKGVVQLDAGGAPEGSAHRAGTLWLAIYSRTVNVEIKRGENTGRQIAYTNVVRQLLPAGKWSGSQQHYDVKVPDGPSYDG
jgi:hypothetical protein